jgi:hypothetical protein
MCWPETYMHVQDVVRSNIGPKLTKSHPGTTHEGWMDKWVDRLFYCVLVSLLTIVVSSVVN